MIEQALPETTSVMQQLTRLFRRETSAGRAFIPEIDGCRFIASISVVLYHINGQMIRYYPSRFPELPALILDHGNRGVRLFFVISGFILALPFARYYLKGERPISLKRYFLRRVTRLEPPYLLALLLLAVLNRLVLHEKLAHIGIHLLATATYCHSLIFGQLSPISAIAWSLEVEVQFYILVPLMTAVFRLSSPTLRRSLLVGIILVLGIVQTAFPGSPRWQLSIGYFLQFFLAGFLLADLYLTTTVTHKSWAWDAVSIVGWPLVFLVPNNTLQWLLPGLAAVLYWAAFHGKLVNAFFRHPLIVCTGGACYSTYLLHYPVIAFATRLAGHQRTLEMWMLSLAMIPVVCGGYFLLIEKPCMNPDWPRDLSHWVKSFGRSPAPSPAEPKLASIVGAVAEIRNEHASDHARNSTD